MSWGRISHPSEIVQVGEKVKVVVLKFDTEKERISLGMKQLTPDPWQTVAEKYRIGSGCKAKSSASWTTAPLSNWKAASKD